MDIVYWGKYVVMILFSILLILLSSRECLAALNLTVKPQQWLLLMLRYLGCFILVYSSYCIIIDIIVY